MNGEAQRVAWLIAGYINKTLTAAEDDELKNWVNESDANRRLFDALSDKQNIEPDLAWMGQIDPEAAYNKMRKKGYFKAPVRSIITMPRLIAASLLFIAFLGYILLARNNFWNRNARSEVADNVQQKKPATGVMLTLGNGEVINISKTANGIIPINDEGRFKKTTDSTLEYAGGGGNQLNTLTTPPGKQFQIKLPDGSLVWINAESSITFPTVFTGHNRIVKLSGEAYFEVAKNAHMPFRVEMNSGAMVEVLGTHFNINAYSNEEAVKTTLLEGLVRMSATADSASAVFIKPGQQALFHNGILKIDPDADIDEAVAWKNGLFEFNEADIKTIMRQLSRWYAIDVTYQGSINKHFDATISRTATLPDVLHMLELTGEVKFIVEDKKVVVYGK